MDPRLEKSIDLELNNELLSENIKSGVSLIRQILPKDFKKVWWIHNLSQDLVVMGGVVCKRLVFTRAELPPQCKVNRYQASVHKAVKRSYLV